MAEKVNTGTLPLNNPHRVSRHTLEEPGAGAGRRSWTPLAQSELKLYRLTASIDGEIAWLDVSLEWQLAWFSTIWGEIVDLRELDVRCDLSPAQADQVAVG